MQPIRSSRKGTLRILESKKPPPVGGGGFVGDHAGSQGLFAFRVSFSLGGGYWPLSIPSLSDWSLLIFAVVHFEFWQFESDGDAIR